MKKMLKYGLMGFSVALSSIDIIYSGCCKSCEENGSKKSENSKSTTIDPIKLKQNGLLALLKLKKDNVEDEDKGSLKITEDQIKNASTDEALAAIEEELGKVKTKPVPPYEGVNLNLNDLNQPYILPAKYFEDAENGDLAKLRKIIEFLILVNNGKLPNLKGDPEKTLFNIATAGNIYLLTHPLNNMNELIKKGYLLYVNPKNFKIEGYGPTLTCTSGENDCLLLVPLNEAILYQNTPAKIKATIFKKKEVK